MKKLFLAMLAAALLAGCDMSGGNNGNNGDSGSAALYAAAYGEIDGEGVWVAGGAGGRLAYLRDSDIEGGDMDQVVNKRYVLGCVDLYAGTAYKAMCEGRGDADMNWAPGIGWTLQVIDKANAGTTSFGTSQYATMQASTKLSVDEACRRLIRPFVVGGAGGKAAFGFDIRNNGDTYWSTVANSTFGTSDIRDIAYGKDRWVAGGAGGKIAYSVDGVNWTGLGTPLGTGAL
jgi:hypothetical protein